MKKIKTIKKRDPMAYDLMTNGLYRQKVIQNKKHYNRKKLRNWKEIMKSLSNFLYLKVVSFFIKA